jgi:hypothetical protein
MSELTVSTMLDSFARAHVSAERLECGSLLPLSRASKRPKAPASRTHSKGFAPLAPPTLLMPANEET